jgi:hypothetical protein
MAIVLELTPEFETPLHGQAAREGLDTNRYILQTLKKHLRTTLKHIPRLVLTKEGTEGSASKRRESELLQDINLGLSENRWQRYHHLIDKRNAETLRANEQTELITISDQIEIANARRMESLLKLAQLRQTSLEELMSRLGLMGQQYV